MSIAAAPYTSARGGYTQPGGRLARLVPARRGRRAGRRGRRHRDGGAARASARRGARCLASSLPGGVRGLGVADGVIGREARRPLLGVVALAFAAAAVAISLL